MKINESSDYHLLSETNDVIPMNDIISNFLRDNSDYDLNINYKVRDIINTMENIFLPNRKLDISLYSDKMNLSKEFIDFIYDNLILVETVMNKPSKIVDSINLKQFETFYSNYLLRCGDYVEPIKLCWLRVAYMLSETLEDFKINYSMLANGQISVSSIIYKRSGTKKQQLISCFLSTPDNNIYSIIECFKNIGLASKNGGGAGISLNRLTSNSKIGEIQYIGVNPWLELFSNVVNIRMRDFKKGAIAIYLPFYHKDVYTFLKSIDDENVSNKNTLMNKLGIYVNNIFLDAVLNDLDIYLFSPGDYPELADKHGDDFYSIYLTKVKNDPNSITLNARELLVRISKSIITSGGPYILNLDAMNLMCNQRKFGLVVSNLCTEITEVADNGNIACCNLAQLPLHNFYIDGTFRFDILASSSRQLVRDLNRTIDITYYPICEELKRYDKIIMSRDDISDVEYSEIEEQDFIKYISENKTYPDKTNNINLRPMGIGISGLYTLFSMMGINYNDPESLKYFEYLCSKIMSCIYFNAIFESCKMSIERGKGLIIDELFQFDLKAEYRNTIQSSEYLTQEYKDMSKLYDQEIYIPEPEDWNQEILTLHHGDDIYEITNYEQLREVCNKFGRLNSLITALMPTITNSITSAGTQAFDPEYSNLYINASGSNQIISVNKYLKNDLIASGWYNQDVLNFIKENGGSVQGLCEYISSTNLMVKNLNLLEAIENNYFTAHEISHDYQMRITHILSHFVDQACSYNMYLENFEDISNNIMKRGLMGFKTILYYARLKTESKSIKHNLDICKECIA